MPRWLALFVPVEWGCPGGEARNSPAGDHFPITTSEERFEAFFVPARYSITTVTWKGG
jgi:hypothetical protein